MAYDRNKIWEQAKQVISDHNLFFIDDIVSYLPIATSTFYEWFPAQSEEMEIIKGLLEQNRVKLKVSMRSKWYKSKAPALQLALMKLIATPEELRKLSMTHIANEEAERPIFNQIDLDVKHDDDVEK